MRSKSACQGCHICRIAQGWPAFLGAVHACQQGHGDPVRGVPYHMGLLIHSERGETSLYAGHIFLSCNTVRDGDWLDIQQALVGILEQPILK